VVNNPSKINVYENENNFLSNLIYLFRGRTLDYRNLFPGNHGVKKKVK
jgi:hypothetical protein